MRLSAHEPALLLPTPTLQERLAADVADVATALVLPQGLLGTPLTQLHGAGAGQILGVASMTELLWATREQLARPGPPAARGAPAAGSPWRPGEADAGRQTRTAPGRDAVRAFVVAYWPALDEIAHRHGPTSAVCDAEVAAYDAALWRELATCRQPRTLVLVTADHGQTTVPLAQTVRLDGRPHLDALLAHPPGGDRRLAYF